eukprot:10643958-Ditylum_brightwellii.AAC.1
MSVLLKNLLIASNNATKKDQELFKKEDLVVAPNPANSVAPNAVAPNDPVVASVISDDDASNNDDKVKFVEEIIPVDIEHINAMYLVCGVTGIKKEEDEDDVIIKNDLSSESDEDTTAVYINFCMFMLKSRKARSNTSREDL